MNKFLSITIAMSYDDDLLACLTVTVLAVGFLRRRPAATGDVDRGYVGCVYE